MKKNDNQQSSTQKQYYLTIEGQEVPVTEEVYRAYKRPDWAEQKRRERERRCYINGHRCTGDCSKCDRQKNGAPLSLDTLGDASGNLPPTSEDAEDIVMHILLLEKLFEEMKELAPTDMLILQLIGDGLSEHKISEALKTQAQINPIIKGLSQKSVNLHKAKLFAMLREKLKDYR